jgi:hypothetical protein
MTLPLLMSTIGIKSCLRYLQCTCDICKGRAIPEDVRIGSRVARNAQKGALVASGAMSGNGHHILLTTHQRKSDAAQCLQEKGMSHQSKRQVGQCKLTDFLRECLYPRVILHYRLAPKKFTRSDLRLGTFWKFEKTLDVPGAALRAMKGYDCVVCIATVRVQPQRMPA